MSLFDKRGNLMEVTVKHLDHVKFAVQARSHTVICDQPAENNGEDAGMTPPEFLLASLGSCAAYYAVEYLGTRNLAQSGVQVTVTAEKLKQPARLGNFQIRVVCPVPLTEEQMMGMTRSVHHCLVHNTLLSIPEIAIEISAAEAAAIAG
jgi:uncharacterized OsmC-like protein